MKIDAHQHFWQFDATRDTWINDSMNILQGNFMPKDIHPILLQNKMDGCVAVQADSSETETKFLLNLAEKHSFIKGVVGWLDLCSSTIEQSLKHYSKYNKLVGLRHIVQAEPDGFMLQDNFLHGISLLEKFQLTYDILIYPHQLEETTQMVARFPKQTFIVNHSAKPYIKAGKIDEWQNQIKQLSQFKNVACKLSGLITEADWKTWKTKDIEPYIDVVIQSFGTERIMFGSDWPVCLLAGDYKSVLELVQNYIKPYSILEQQNIMGLNAKNWYQLKD